MVRSLITKQEKQAELEEVSEKALVRLKKLASPKENKLEHMKWRGLYVGIDASGNITHPLDITTEDYQEFRGIAGEHHLYATLLHNAIINASKEVIANYKFQADQFRLIFENRPLSVKQIETMFQSGQLSKLMAGFAYYLVRHNLFL